MNICDRFNSLSSLLYLLIILINLKTENNPPCIFAVLKKKFCKILFFLRLDVMLVRSQRTAIEKKISSPKFFWLLANTIPNTR